VNWQRLLSLGKNALAAPTIQVVSKWSGAADPKMQIRANGLVLTLQDFDGYDYHFPHLVQVSNEHGNTVGGRRCNYRLSRDEWYVLARKIERALKPPAIVAPMRKENP